MFGLNNLFIASRPPLSVNYLTTIIAAGAISQTVSFGPPKPGRILVIGNGSYQIRHESVTSVLVAGNPAFQAISPGASNRYADIWYIRDGENSSGDITVTWSDSVNFSYLDVWEILGAASITPISTATSGNLVYSRVPVAAIGVGQRAGAMSLTGFSTDYYTGSAGQNHIAGSALIEALNDTYSVNDATTSVIAAWA